MNYPATQAMLLVASEQKLSQKLQRALWHPQMVRKEPPCVPLHSTPPLPPLRFPSCAVKPSYVPQIAPAYVFTFYTPRVTFTKPRQHCNVRKLHEGACLERPQHRREACLDNLVRFFPCRSQPVVQQ